MAAHLQQSRYSLLQVFGQTTDREFPVAWEVDFGVSGVTHWQGILVWREDLHTRDNRCYMRRSYVLASGNGYKGQLCLLTLVAWPYQPSKNEDMSWWRVTVYNNHIYPLHA